MRRNEHAIRVLIVDDHPIFRRGLSAYLAEEDGLDVIGEAGTSSDALQLAEELRPHVVVMDINMPEVDGIETTRRLRKRAPHAKVLILTFHEDSAAILAAARAGARGFINKVAPGAAVVDGIRTLHREGTYFGPEASQVIVEAFVQEAESWSGETVRLRRSEPSASKPATTLTRRETEVLTLVARGLTSREIAQQLSISTRTVEAHRAKVGDKLGIRTVAELTRFAVEHGLI